MDSRNEIDFILKFSMSIQTHRFSLEGNHSSTVEATHRSGVHFYQDGIVLNFQGVRGLSVP